MGEAATYVSVSFAIPRPVFTPAIPAFTTAIPAFTCWRSGCSHAGDLGVHATARSAVEPASRGGAARSDGALGGCGERVRTGHAVGRSGEAWRPGRTRDHVNINAADLVESFFNLVRAESESPVTARRGRTLPVNVDTRPRGSVAAIARAANRQN